MTNPREDSLIESDLMTLYEVDVPDLRFDPPRAPEVLIAQRRRVLVGKYWRPVLAAASAVAILSAVLIAPAFWDGEAPSVSAEQVLQRASASAQSAAPADGTLSYHMVSTAGKLEMDAEFTTETWYGGTGRFRIEDRGGPEGFLFGQIVNGDDVWMYQTLDGVTRVAHGPASGLGKGFSGEFLGGQQSLADVLAQHGGSCQSPNQVGEDTFLGRAVYVIEVTTDPNLCASDEDNIKARAIAGSSLSLWVDRETFLTLKTEHREPDGRVSFRQVATEFTVSPNTPESVFTYEAPSGETVVEVTDLGQAKEAISPLATNDSKPPEPCSPANDTSGKIIANKC